MPADLLRITSLEKHFEHSSNIFQQVAAYLRGGGPKQIRAVDGVDLTINRNEVKGIVGESGCGKSTFLNTLIGLYEPTRGEIEFDGRPMSEFTSSDWKAYRSKVQIIFQDPYSALDPKFSVRRIVEEPLRIHGIEGQAEKIDAALNQVNLDPEKYASKKPPQLSGGEAQRVNIARALVLEPDIILADEPISMLDVSTQTKIINLFNQLLEELNIAIIFITHDISIASYICDELNVMYLGRIVESGETRDVLQDPKHPYSRALIDAIPIPDPHFDREHTQLSGGTADPLDLPSGCRFKDRCPERMPVCDQRPRTITLENGDRQVACHLYDDDLEEQAQPREANAQPSPPEQQVG